MHNQSFNLGQPGQFSRCRLQCSTIHWFMRTVPVCVYLLLPTRDRELTEVKSVRPVGPRLRLSLTFGPSLA